MNWNRKSLRLAGPAAIVAAAMLVSTVNVRTAPGTGTVEVSLASQASAFDPVSYVWDKFKTGVLEKYFKAWPEQEYYRQFGSALSWILGLALLMR